MTPTTAALATIVLLFVLLAIVTAYGIYVNIKLQREVEDMERKDKEIGNDQL